MMNTPTYRRDGLPTGTDTAVRNDVADPHPEVHEDTDKVPHPGGVRRHLGPDIGPNSYAHDGTPPPKPDYRRPTLELDDE